MITAFENAEHERITILKKIPFNDENVTIYVIQSFNILFIEIPDKDYYLTIARECVYTIGIYLYTNVIEPTLFIS